MTINVTLTLKNLSQVSKDSGHMDKCGSTNLAV